MANTFKDRLTQARGHRQRGEHEPAEALYTQLAREQPGFADVQNELGLLLHDRGEFERAAQAFETALTINPRYTEAALHLAITWNDMGRYEDARAVYERVVARSRATHSVVDPLVAGKIANLYADIGDAFLSAGAPSRAVNAYRDALELGPAFHDIRVRLAQALQEVGDPNGAAQQLEQVLGVNPDNLGARVALGLAQLSGGDKEAAITTWRDVLARSPGHTRATQYMRLAGAVP